MKKYIYLIFIFAILLMSWDFGKNEIAIAAPNENIIPKEAIRLRIIANSDSVEDQLLKRKIRDEVTEQISLWVGSLEDLDQARTVINKHLPEIDTLVNETIKASGYSYKVKVELGVFPFPTKMYGQIVYPAGDYEALRITIGEGQGQNWWCVLFPPLCFVDMSNGDAVTKTNDTTKEKTEIRFFLVDIFYKIKSVF